MSDVKFLVTVDSKKGTAAIKKLDDNVDKLGKTSQKAAPGIKAMWKQMAGGIAIAYGVIRSIKGLTRWMGDAIDKAGIQEDAEKSLEAALESTGRRVETNAEHYKNYASELQKATRFGDEQIIGAQSLLLQLTKLDREGIDVATKGSMGLATVYKQDLYAATTLVGKALAGNYGALSRYGIVVKQSATDEEKRASILEQLTVMYGRAEADVETYRGGVAQLGNTYGDLKEQIGDAVVRNEDFRDSIREVNEAMRAIIDSGVLANIVEMLGEGWKFLSKWDKYFVLFDRMAGSLYKQAEATREASKEAAVMDEQIIKWSSDLMTTAEMQEIENQKIREAKTAYHVLRQGILEAAAARRYWNEILKEAREVKVAPDPKEILESLWSPDIPGLFEAEWDTFEATYDEKINAFQDSLMASVGLGLTSVTGMTEDAANQQLSTMDKIQTATSMVAGFSKETAIISAIINTYQAASKTIAMMGMPWAIPFVALAIASGLKQVAAIKAQSIPSAATGADVLREGLVHVHPGEVIRQPASLKETFREVVREPGGGGQPIYITLENHMAGQKVSEAHWKITNEGFRRGKIKIRNIQ